MKIKEITESPLEEPVIETPPLENVESVEETIIETLPDEAVEPIEESLTIETPEEPAETLLNVDEAAAYSEQIQENIVEKVQETIQEIAPTSTETDETEKLPDLTKRSVADKMFKAIEQDFDSLKYHYEESERKITRGLLISYIVIAVLFALLIFSFFKFSSDIKGLEDEIKSLKKNPTSSLIDTKSISSTHHFFC